MAFYRKYELDYLENCFLRPSNEVVVMYGKEGNVLTDIIRQFVKKKDYFYYRARACSDREQIHCFMSEIRGELQKGAKDASSWSELISAMLSVKCEKRLIVIEDFQHIVKPDSDFIREVIKALHNKWNNQPLMFLLTSSSVSFVENQMEEKLSESAYEISGILKVPELKFLDLVRHFKNYNVLSGVETYSILGGYENLWKCFDDEISVSDNICKCILKKDGYLYSLGEHILPDELREPAVYNTLLLTLASGKVKLNEIYKHTGFSRAKISVYLKNLMELDLVEKVDSFDTPGRDNAQKGIYRIKDSYTAFWYRFIYSNLSKVDVLEPAKFSKKYIEPYFKEYVSECFVRVCSEYLNLMNQMGRLQYNFTHLGAWVGKVGTIDIVASDDNGHTIIGSCNWERSVMSYDDFEWLIFCMEQAKLTADYYYLFSATTFDEKLRLEAKMSDNIILIDSTQL